MLVIGRPLRSAIGYTIIAAICFDPDLSRTLDIHRSLLPLVLFVVFEAARPIAELVEQSLIAICGALIGLLLSSWCILIGSRTLNLICFIVYNFIFAFYRLKSCLFVGYLCASICTQLVLVVPKSPSFHHGLQFVSQLSTSCLLIILSVAILWPPTSASLLRTRLVQCFKSLSKVMSQISVEYQGRADQNPPETFRSTLAQLSIESSSLPDLLRSASIELQFNHLPMSACQVLSRSMYEVTSQLQGLSSGRHMDSISSDVELVPALRNQILDTLDALQVICCDLSTRLLEPDNIPEEDLSQKVKLSLEKFQTTIITNSGKFTEDLNAAIPALVLLFRLEAISAAIFIADNTLRYRHPYPMLQFPTISFTSRATAPSYAMIGGKTRQSSATFSAKMALTLGLLALPSFIEEWRWFFERWITTWAMVTASVILTPTLGAVQTAITFRLVGTILGATSAMIVAVLFRSQPIGLVITTFVLSLVSYRIRFGNGRKLFRSLIVTWQLMFTNVIVNTITRGNDEPWLIEYTVPIEIAVQTGLALLLCWTMMIVVVPTLARDLLRQGLSDQLLWFGVLFDHLSKRIVIEDNNTVDADQAALERHLRWQQNVKIVELLHQAKAEPNPFGATFKSQEWDRLLQTTSHLLESIELAHAAVQYRPSDDDDLSGVHVSAPLINEFFVLAAALHSGISLPPMTLVCAGQGQSVFGSRRLNEDNRIRHLAWKATFDLATQDTIHLLVEVQRTIREILGEFSFKIPHYEPTARRPLNGLKIIL